MIRHFAIWMLVAGFASAAIGRAQDAPRQDAPRQDAPSQDAVTGALVPAEAVFLKVQAEVEGAERELRGEVLIEAEDGGLLLMEPDQRIWLLQPAAIRDREVLAEALPMLDARELEKKLLEELPAGFRIEKTPHFLIAYNSDRQFAKWVGNLYEKLLRGYLDWWKKKHGLVWQAPEVPLVVLVFGTHEEYTRHVQRELGQPPGSMVAYYNLMTNRVALFDMTIGLGPSGNNRNIAEIVRSPGAVEMVTTIIHEGTHQLMFNTGMQTRFADTPLWVNEGLAMFFETPDANNPQGFRAIGQVNLPRLNRMVVWSRNRSPDSLQTLLSDDSVLRSPDSLLDRYAEAWAFNYFLLQRHGKEYAAYLEFLGNKPRMVYDSPDQRLADFQRFIDVEWTELDREFLEFLAGLLK